MSQEKSMSNPKEGILQESKSVWSHYLAGALVGVLGILSVYLTTTLLGK